MVPDFIIFAKESTTIALVVQLGGWDPENDGDAGLQQYAQRELVGYLRKVNCTRALTIHPHRTYTLRLARGEDGHPLTVAASMPTTSFLKGPAQNPVNGRIPWERLDHLTNEWLERLTISPDEAVPAEAKAAFCPEIVEAVSGGRVVWELVAECQRRLDSRQPRFLGQLVQAHLRALADEWERTGGFDEAHMHALLERLRTEDRVTLTP